jgi:hypothetical protein
MKEVGALLERARGHLAQVDETGRADAEDALNDLAGEVASNDRKESRLKRYAASAINAAPKVAGFTNTILGILKTCGVDPASVAHLLTHTP